MCRAVIGCFFVLIVFGENAKAQIAAIIIDRSTHNPLAIANISLQNITDSILHKTVTTDSGFCSFKNIASGKYILSVSYVGYDSFSTVINITAGTTLVDTIQLNPSAKNLNQVVITSEKNFLQFKPNLITLNVAQSPVATNGSAYDVVKLAPGVVETIDGLSFRGKKTLIMINGRPTYLNQSELKQMLVTMPATDIDKVQIIPNPSAKYDADALSVIDIRLAKNNSYGINGTITGGIGTGAQLRYNGGLSLNYRNNKINIYGSYNYEHNQQYFITNSNLTVTPTSHILESINEQRVRYNNNYKAGADYEISKNSTAGVLFTGYTNFRDRSSTDNITLQHQAPVPDSFSMVTMTGRARFFNPTVNAYYKTTFDSSGKTLTINADYFNYNKHWSDNFITNYYAAGKVPYRPAYLLRDSSPVNNNVYSLTADYSNPIKNGRIEAGIKTTSTATDNNVLWQYQNGANWLVDSTLTNHFVYTERINAGYISYDKNFGKYEVIVGLRAEQTTTRSNLLTKEAVHDSNYWGLFPNVSLQYSKDDNNIFSIGYRKSIQRPDFDVINPFIVYVSEYSFFVGNPYLKPQIDNSFSLSYTYKQSLNLAVNYTYSTDAIADIMITGNNNSVGITTGNINKEDAFSFSANWGGKINKYWNISVTGEADYAAFNENYSKSYMLDNNGWYYQGLLQNIFKFNKGWSAELGANYHSAIPYGVYMVSPSFKSDVGIQKMIMHQKGKLALSITDIFNTEVINYSTNFMGIDKSVDYKEESRFIKLQFTYKFGNKNVKEVATRESTIADIDKRMKN
ncbi:MAG TPA: outer membrane beta-barrel family protein [Ferruginibacter sp.]|nr:outer membrane beta-barrel family protein [Ferruginibacter sp.]